jgi:DNA-binding PadR family transcriptional regulator
MKELTSTSYAMLGLLALRPWTTYELATQVSRSLVSFWPRTERQLYEEPKNLVAYGYARSRSEKVGNRKRTIYTITRKGRGALTAWLDTPGRGPVLEFENLLKIFFAEAGTREQLSRNIAAIRAEAERAQVSREKFTRDWETDFMFPERLHLSALVGQFLNQFNDEVVRWARWAEKEVASWPDPLPEKKRVELAARVFSHPPPGRTRGRSP